MSVIQQATFKSFAESTKEEWDVIQAGLDDVRAQVAQNVLDQLAMLRSDAGGFPVDRLEHSLQTATRAERDGRDDEYVLCALVHDMGDILAPWNHPAIAAAVLQPYVSDANHWMVQHHGIFQGYYFWQHIGLDPDTREQFRGSPYFDYTAEFCAKYDQVAFDADYKSEPLEHYEPLVRELLSPANGHRQAIPE